jgi:spermidine/putrescine transport system ATP-binding protein
MSDRVGVMSNGKLQQVGSAKEIYTKPKNRFVASFIGETNFLAAKAEGGKARLASGDVVDLEGGVSGDVTLTVRPEQVRLVPLGEAGALAATITNLVYFGTDTHVHLALSDGTEVTARVQSPATGEAGLEPGAKAALRFAPGAVQVVGD